MRCFSSAFSALRGWDGWTGWRLSVAFGEICDSGSFNVRGGVDGSKVKRSMDIWRGLDVILCGFVSNE
jgi:hypothetical protein